MKGAIAFPWSSSTMSMRFISPKTDFAFKKIFGSNRSQKILISFLNAIVYEGKNTIKSLEIIDPYNPGSTSTLKDTYLDVRAVLDNGSTVIIEMQVLNVEAFEKRVIYNIAKAYANQLDMGEQYTRLRPFIALSIADFLLFKNSSQMINRFRLKEEKQLFNYRDELTLIFLELPKFNKELSELETLSDKWIYFLKAAPSLEMIPESLGAVPEIEEALTIASRANLSNQELEELHKQEVFIGDRKGEINLAKIEQNLKLISLILKQKFGRVNPVIMNKIEQLSLSELDRLIESILTLTTWEDVEEWLDD